MKLTNNNYIVHTKYNRKT